MLMCFTGLLQLCLTCLTVYDLFLLPIYLQCAISIHAYDCFVSFIWLYYVCLRFFVQSLLPVFVL